MNAGSAPVSGPTDSGNSREKATAFAPATVANVAVGFDLLGFAVQGVGDRVTVTRTQAAGLVEIEAIEGDPAIPLDPAQNTATVGLLKLMRDLQPAFGLQVRVNKGIPLGSGLGGSAASAVGAIVAANALLEKPLTREALFSYALEGETAASGARHGDNVAPCLWGGLVLCRSVDPPRIVPVPVPQEVLCVLVHPEVRVDTREARKVLSPQLALGIYVKQSSHLAAFLAGCFQGDLELVGESLRDELIEPQRAELIPGFAQVKNAAMRGGALGCSISGSGPCVFAWVSGEEQALRIRGAMVQEFERAGVRSVRSWISPVGFRGAHVVEE